MDTALDVLASCELHELAMETVAAAAGIAKPVLYTVFRTRAELVGELLHREHQRGIAQISATLPTDLTTLGRPKPTLLRSRLFCRRCSPTPRGGD
ncbi:bacterial regulatory s, tetR family protein [Mycobacterium xenopi 3993]|nr:bacterial regulatory s, tetR family protein [Mycobacterium xenopi 3993]